MHRMTRDVLRATQSLEFEQFTNPDDRERLREVRALALSQVADDVENTSGNRRDSMKRRHGAGTRAEHTVDLDSGRPLWAPRTEDQMNLEVTFAPMLRELTKPQREAVNLLFYGMLTERETAEALGVTKRAVVTARDRALAWLRRVIVERFNLEDVPIDSPGPRREPPRSGRAGTCRGRVLPVPGSHVEFDTAWLDEPRIPVPRQPVGHLELRSAAP